MDTLPEDGPNDLPDLWVVHLNEPTPPPAPPDSGMTDADGPTLTLFESADPPSSDAGFHPRLRRFGEAA